MKNPEILIEMYKIYGKPTVDWMGFKVTKNNHITYHHIKEDRNGGLETVENGALLSAENHEWFNRQSKEKQRQMNDMFQEYKRNYDIHCATLVIKDRGIEAQALKEDENIEMELSEEIERGYIEVELMTEEDLKIYEEHKRKRNEIVFNKFKGDER